jgi:hypothetical protein
MLMEVQFSSRTWVKGEGLEIVVVEIKSIEVIYMVESRIGGPRETNSSKKLNDQGWNNQVKKKVYTLKTAQSWLRRMKDSPNNDWESQKSAHQALRFLQLAEYEMWTMQWFNEKELKDHRKAYDNYV